MPDFAVSQSDGNLGSLVQMIVDDLHMPGVEDVVRRKALQVMRFHRDKRYFFSDREVRFNLTANHAVYKPGDGYGLPADVVEVAGPTIWILIGGSDDMRQRCDRSSTVDWEDSRAVWGNSKSQPEQWDFRLGSLRFSPTPSSSTDVAELRYITDLRVPKVTYDGGTASYKYWHPESNAELTVTQVDTWTNDWLTQQGAEAAIRARTTYEMQKTYLKDEEGAASSLGLWLEMVAQLEAETESRTGGVYYMEGQL